MWCVLIIHMINTDDPTSGARTSALRDARWRVSRVSPSGRAPRGARVRADGTRAKTVVRASSAEDAEGVETAILGLG